MAQVVNPSAFTTAAHTRLDICPWSCSPPTSLAHSTNASNSSVNTQWCSGRPVAANNSDTSAATAPGGGSGHSALEMGSVVDRPDKPSALAVLPAPSPSPSGKQDTKPSPSRNSLAQASTACISNNRSLCSSMSLRVLELDSSRCRIAISPRAIAAGMVGLAAPAGTGHSCMHGSTRKCVAPECSRALLHGLFCTSIASRPSAALIFSR